MQATHAAPRSPQERDPFSSHRAFYEGSGPFTNNLGFPAAAVAVLELVPRAGSTLHGGIPSR